MTYDFIGSGFGGSVSALRLAEKGRRVLVLEQGRHVTDQDMAAVEKNPLKLFWAPTISCLAIRVSMWSMARPSLPM